MGDGRVFLGLLVGPFAAVLFYFLQVLILEGSSAPLRVVTSLVFLLSVGAFYWGLIGSYLREKRRTAAMERYAKGRGWSFDPRGKTFDFSSWADLPMFSESGPRWLRPDPQQARNVISGVHGSAELFAFDYRWSDPDNRENTVVCLRSNSLALPQFALDPAFEMLERVAAAVGQSDINFESNPDFSRMYSLRGSNESEIRAAFGPEVLEFFQTHPGYHLEGSGKHVVVYRTKTKVVLTGLLAPAALTKPDDTPSLIEESLSVLMLFRGASACRP